MSCPHTIDVAAYLLDALEPDETQRLRRHLPGCPQCRPEYDQLRGLPDELRRLGSSDVHDIVAPTELPAELCDELLAKATARRSRRTRRRMLVLTAAAAAASVIAGLALPRSADSLTVSATDPQTHVHADITLTARSWGTQIRLRLSGVASAQQCMLVVGSAQDQRDVAATWVATYQGSAEVTGTTALPTARIEHLDVITTSGRRLVSVPPPAH